MASLKRYQTNLIPLLLLFSLCFLMATPVHVQIKNSQTGYKLILEGKAGRLDDRLVMNPVQILVNTLTINERLDFMQFFGHKIELDLKQLAESEKGNDKQRSIIQTHWIQKPKISVTFTFSEGNNVHGEDFDNLYTFINQKCSNSADEDF